MRPFRMLFIGLLVLAGWRMFAVPGYPQHANAVQSLSIAEADAIIGQSGPCLVVVMAAWCHPCIEELPALGSLARKYQPRGLRVLGLSVDYAGPQAIQPLIDRSKIDFPVYWVGEAALDAYGITRIPLLIFVRDGQTVKRLEGKRRPADIEAEIGALLATP